jgi:hypothetical protein
MKVVRDTPSSDGPCVYEVSSNYVERIKTYGPDKQKVNRRTDGHTDGQTDNPRHTIIRPVDDGRIIIGMYQRGMEIKDLVLIRLVHTQCQQSSNPGEITLTVLSVCRLSGNSTQYKLYSSEVLHTHIHTNILIL